MPGCRQFGIFSIFVAPSLFPGEGLLLLLGRDESKLDRTFGRLLARRGLGACFETLAECEAGRGGAV